jgi:DNA-binding transcriptional regulator YdaS (Cro superfamily)
MKQKTSIETAIFKAGGQTALSKIVLVSPQAVNQWAARNTIPSDKVIAVEKASGISRTELRPDLYPPENLTPVAL